MKKEIERVAVVKCKSYRQEEVDKAVVKALKLLEFDTKKYRKIVIKPNVLGVYKDSEAIITHPSIVKAIEKQFKGEIIIGESSFMDTDKALKSGGYSQFRNTLIFEQFKLVKIKDKEAKVLKSFLISKKLRDADLVINVPKMKTHGLTKMTGALKNLYGVIPGGMKQKFHKLAIGDHRFSNLLVDIYQNVSPKLNIMDCVVAMEGEGPSSGKAKKVGLILASRNAVALDIAASKIMGFNPKKILVIREAVKRKLYPNYNIEVVGDLRELPNLKFCKSSAAAKTLIRSFLGKLVKDNPITVDEAKCIKCRTCMDKCPMHAISMKPYPFIDKKKCIRCFCCIEVCPKHALYLKETRLRRVLKRLRGMNRK